jgi:hypothetical protein
MKEFSKTFFSTIGDVFYTMWLVSLGLTIVGYVHGIRLIEAGPGVGVAYIAVVFACSVARWSLRRWAHGWLASKVNATLAWALIEIPALVMIAGAGYAIGVVYLGIPWGFHDTRLETQESIAFLLFITLLVKWVIDAVETGIKRPDDGEIKQVA